MQVQWIHIQATMQGKDDLIESLKNNMRVVNGVRLAFQAERGRFDPCSPLHKVPEEDRTATAGTETIKQHAK